MMASVIRAMADLQLQIEDLDAEISNAEDDAASTSIYAGVTNVLVSSRSSFSRSASPA